MMNSAGAVNLLLSLRPLSLKGRGVLKQLIHKDIEQRRTATYSFLPSPLEGEGLGERGKKNGSKR